MLSFRGLISPDSFSILPHTVALLSSCFSYPYIHLPNFRKVSVRKSGPTSCIFSITFLVVRSNLIGNFCIATISPVSSEAAIFMIVIQVSFSLLRNTDWIGEAPRYLGKSEPCTLIGATSGMSRIACGIIFPYAITTI